MTASVLAAALVAVAAPRAAPASEALLREAIGETALAQARAIDPRWPDAQRDCAGLVRFAYRAAYKRFAPARLERGLWRDGRGTPAPFADAATLLAHSFALLGRGDEARAELRSGDLAAFSRVDEGGAPVLHLMLIVRAGDRAHAPTSVVYHPGERDQDVRVGTLEAFLADAPPAWRPRADNPLFLGFYRFKEWMP